MTGKHKTRGRRAGESADLTTADIVVLSLLDERPMHGYDLLAEYERQEVVDWASVSKAQVYYALRKLAERSLVTARADESTVRERMTFAVTRSGRAALRAALETPSWAMTRVAQPFTTWFGLSIHLTDEARAVMLRARREHLVQEIERERASFAFIATLDTPRAQRGAAIVRLVIAQIEAELAWLATLL